jgi:PAS domain-containing protein
LTNLTQQKEQDELIAAGKLATAILENTADAIAVCDETGKIISTNAQLEKLCGFNPLLQPFDVALQLELSQETPGPAQKFSISTTLAGDYRSREVRFRRNDGQTGWLFLSPSRIAVSSDIVGCVLALTDITKQKLAQEQLRAIAERLQRVTEFLLFQQQHNVLYVAGNCYVAAPISGQTGDNGNAVLLRIILGSQGRASGN